MAYTKYKNVCYLLSYVEYVNLTSIDQIIYLVIERAMFDQLQVTFFPGPLKRALSSVHGKILSSMSLIEQPYCSWVCFYG